MWNPLELLSRLLTFLDRHRGGTMLVLAVALSWWVYAGGFPAPVRPLREALELSVGTLRAGTTGAFTLLNVWIWKENHDLKAALVRERLDRVRLAETVAENERLRALLGFTPPPRFRAVPCTVTSFDPEPLGGSITVDRGSRAGVVPGEAVVSIDGLVGHVAEVFPGRARVRLVTHYESPVGVRVQRNRVLGVLEWDPASSRLLMRNVPATQEVAPGDTLVSSGLGGVYPEGLYVGRVDTVQPDPMGLVQEIVVRPGARFNQLSEVFLLAPEPR